MYAASFERGVRRGLIRAVPGHGDIEEICTNILRVL